MTMNHDEIKAHWQDWAKTHGTSLRATTKTMTAKRMELDALERAFRRVVDDGRDGASVLEIGCGNGQNCLHLAETFPALRFLGIDYVGEMVASAQELKARSGLGDDRLRFMQGDVLKLDGLGEAFDIVFTDRCLINLNTDELQMQALSSLCNLLKPAGHLIMIENSATTFGLQNQAREIVGLPARKAAEFNHFFDEAVILPHLEAQGMAIELVEDFISLHDLVLYVLVPLINEGQVDYEHPLVEAATKLNIALGGGMGESFGPFGQNRLFICRRPQ